MNGGPHATGFTLVEMLVVLAILGVVAGATLLAVGIRDDDHVGALEARRLAGRLRLAADDVRIDERPLALTWDSSGYAFVDWDVRMQRWQPDPVPELGERRALPAGLKLAVAGAAGPRAIAADGAGVPIEARVTGRSSGWQISFDGLDAAVVRIGALL